MVSKVGGTKAEKALADAQEAARKVKEAAADAERGFKERVAEVGKEADKPDHVVAAEEANAAHAKAMQERLDAQDEEAKRMLANAANIAERLSSSTVFNDFIDHTLEAIKDAEYKTVATWRHMTNILTKDELAMLPIPDSTEDAMKKARGDNYQGNEPLVFDKIKVHYKNSAGDMKTKVSSYYFQLASMLPAGASAAKVLEEVELANNSKTNASKAYVEMSKQERNSRASDANRTLRNLRIAVKGAANIIIMSREIENKLPKVGVSWIEEEDGTVVKRPKCLVIYNKSKVSDTWEKTINQFLGFKLTPDVIRRGTAQALNSSAKDYRDAVAEAEKKKTQATTPVADTKWNQVSNREMLDALTQSLAFYTKGNMMEQGKRHTEFREQVMRSDEDKMTVVAIYRLFKALCEANNGELMTLADQAEQRISDAMKAKQNAPAPTPAPATQAAS